MSTVDMNDLKPNSHKYREEQANKEERKIEKVVEGTAIKKKKSLSRRFFNIFFSESIEDVTTYVLYDIIVPAIKENIVDIINSTTSMMFLGETRRKRGGRGQSTGGVTRINYGGYFSGNQSSEKMPSYRNSNIPSKVDELVLESRGDAELVLDQMLEIIDQYGKVTVSDYYDLMGVSTTFTDNKYGWRDLRNARIIKSGRDGYLIDLPRESILEK